MGTITCELGTAFYVMQLIQSLFLIVSMIWAYHNLGKPSKNIWSAMIMGFVMYGVIVLTTPLLYSTILGMI